MDCRVPDFPILHYLPEFAQSQVYWVGDAIQQSHPLPLPLSSCLQSFLASGSFPMSQLFALGGQSSRTSGSSSVLPINTQGWFPLGLTGLNSSLSKGFSRFFSSSIIQKHQFFSAQPFLWSNSHSCTCCAVLSHSVVSDFATPWTVPHQAPLSMGILQARILEWIAMPSSRGSSQPRSPALQADSLPPEPPGKPKNTGVGSLSLLQGIFLTQESNWGFLHCRKILYQLSYQGSPWQISRSIHIAVNGIISFFLMAE